jgi:hypothetical protein
MIGAGTLRRFRRAVAHHTASILLLAAVAAVALGTWGYLSLHYEFLNAVYGALGLFGLGHSAANDQHLPIPLQLGRFLAYGVTAGAAAAAAWLLLRNEFDGLRARRARDHVLMCGLGDRGLQFVRAFVANGERVIAIERDRANPNIAAARELGVPVVIGDGAQADALRSANVPRASHVICVLQSDDANAAAAAALREIPPERRQYVHCHVSNPLLDEALSARSIASDDGERVVAWFNIERLAAKSLLSDYFAPLVQSKALGDQLTGFAILGATVTARSTLIEATRQWRALRALDSRSAPATAPLKRLPVTLIAPDPGDWLDKTRAICPGLDEVLAVTVITEDPLTTAWTPHGCQVVFVLLDDAAEALAAGLRIDIRRDPACTDIIVRVYTEALPLAQATLSAGRALAPLRVVNIVDTTCTVDLVENTLIEELARENHRVYQGNVPGLPASRSWFELPEAYRAANRAAAVDHIRHKLTRIGLHPIPVSDQTEDELVTLTDEQVELLAQMEHERWMSDRRIDGWNLGARDDDTRSHPDLVPWAQLPEAARDKDRMFIRELPRMLAACGYQLAAAGSVALTEGDNA